jgi:hypothetical protein
VKYIVAAVGSFIVFVGTFLAVLMGPIVISTNLYKSMAFIYSLYAVGVPLAILTAVLSFRSTLKYYAKQADESRPRRKKGRPVEEEPEDNEN